MAVTRDAIIISQKGSGANIYRSLDEVPDQVVAKIDPINTPLILLDGTTVMTQAQFDRFSEVVSINATENYTDMGVDIFSKTQNTLTINGDRSESTADTEILYFKDVNLNDFCAAGVSLSKDKNFSLSGKNKDDFTATYAIDGTVKLNNSEIGGIENYKTVTLTNSSAGDIILDNQTKLYVDDDDKDGDDNYRAYAANGAVTVKADKKGNLGGFYSVGDIAGYKSVTITGYTDKKIADNNIKIYAGAISGGNHKDWYYGKEASEIYHEAAAAGTLKVTYAQIGTEDITKNITGFSSVTLKDAQVWGDVLAYELNFAGIEAVCGSFSRDVDSDDNAQAFLQKAAAAGSFTLNNGTVSGDIKGYKSISITDGSIGNADAGLSYTRKYNFKKTKSKTTTTVTKSLSYTETSNGSFTAKNAEVASITGCNTVKLTNSSVAGNATNWVESFSAEYKTTTKNKVETVNKDIVKVEKKASGSFTMTVDKNTETASAGNIIGFDKVTITGYSSKGVEKFVEVGSIQGGKFTAVAATNGKSFNEFTDLSSFLPLEGGTLSASSSVTLTNNVYVNGSITGYNKVTIKKSTVDGSLESTPAIASEFGDDIVANTVAGAAVALTDSKVTGDIEGYKSFTATGIVSAASFTGTASNDSVTIAAKSLLTIGSVDLCEGTKDKMTVNGAVILSELTGVETLAGKGVIAASGSNFEAVAETAKALNFKGTLVDLGDTQNFSGVAEKNDDTAKKAFKMTGDTLEGWLNGSYDNVDFIKFTAGEADTLIITGDTFVQVALNGVAQERVDGVVTIDLSGCKAGSTCTLELSVAKESAAADYQVHLA